MKKVLAAVGAIFMAIVLLGGCGGKKVASVTPIQELKAPDWVTKGGGAFDEDEDKVFHGVGSASGIRNQSLLRSTADDRAREDLAKVFQFYTASLMKDYAASTTAMEPGVTSEEQHVEQAIKTVTSATLSGVQIVDHWQHPETGEYFSLAKLNLEEFGRNLDRLAELNSKVKEQIRQNAERLHDELKEEEDRMRDR